MAKTSPQVNGCSAVKHFEHGFNLIGDLCKLNASHPCNDNTMLALRQGCLSGGLAVLLSIVLLVILLVLVGVYCKLLRKRKSEYLKSSEKEPLLNKKQSSELNVKMHRSYGSHCHTSPSIKSLTLSIARRESTELQCSASMSTEGNGQFRTETPVTLSKEFLQSQALKPASSSLPPSPTPSVLLSQYSELDASTVIRDEEREVQMNSEANHVMELSREMIKYQSLRPLPDLGSRLQKYWYSVKTGRHGEEILVTVKKSKQCQLDLDNPLVIDVLKTLFQCIKHPYLQVVYDITHKEDYVGIHQKFVKKGSVRDHIFEASPRKDWIDKYKTQGGHNPFSRREIAQCGHQVLEAVKILYDLGFTHIGQIQSGNVFISSDNFVLGGFENSLLGYRTSIYEMISKEDLLDKIDIIMFGHLMYEMCSMRLLTAVHPSDLDYLYIEDLELQDLIKFIFTTASKTESERELMKEISLHLFFLHVTNTKKHNDIMPIDIPPEVIRLINNVFPKELNLEIITSKLHGKYTDIQLLPKLGWRLGKIWARAHSVAHNIDGLLTTISVPNTCPIFVDVSINDIKKLLQLQHDHIFGIIDIDQVTFDGQHVVVIFQEIQENGSLRDIIYQGPPLTVWASKYKRRSTNIKSKDIFSWGAQILQAMCFLSHLEGPDKTLILGFVHTGNIFVEGNTCKLGGFENTLFGLQTGRHFKFEDYSDEIDLFMFGHVIFEMSTGKELMTAVPSEKEYNDVPKSLRQILRCIFERQYSRLEEVMTVFGCTLIVSKPLHGDVAYLLEKVRKGKARNQGSHLGRGKFYVQAKLHKLKEIVPS